MFRALELLPGGAGLTAEDRNPGARLISGKDVGAAVVKAESQAFAGGSLFVFEAGLHPGSVVEA